MHAQLLGLQRLACVCAACLLACLLSKGSPVRVLACVPAEADLAALEREVAGSGGDLESDWAQVRPLDYWSRPCNGLVTPFRKGYSVAATRLCGICVVGMEPGTGHRKQVSTLG